MNPFGMLLAFTSAGAALGFYAYTIPPYAHAGAAVFGLFALYCTTLKIDASPAAPVIVRMNGLKWTLEQFCRNWLIIGDTGAGKTSSGINNLLFQVSQNAPGWGGLCIDEKGLYWQTLRDMAAHFSRQDDLILLQVLPSPSLANWQPPHRFNLTGDRSIPFTAYSKAVVDTVSSFVKGDKGFFKTQAETHIAMALEALYESQAAVTFKNAHAMPTNQEDLDEVLSALRLSTPTRRRQEIIDHFTKGYMQQAPRAALRRRSHDRKLPPLLHHARDRRRVLLHRGKHLRAVRP